MWNNDYKQFGTHKICNESNVQNHGFPRKLHKLDLWSKQNFDMQHAINIINRI